MKKIMQWVLAATLVCGASVFTSCNVDAIDNPVIPVKCPTITTQPKSVTYNIGDTKYPKMSVEAKSSAGDLKYEWFMEGEDGSYYSSGITTAELDLYAFIDNMITVFGDDAIGCYTFICKVTDWQGTVESDPATLTLVAYKGVR